VRQKSTRINTRVFPLKLIIIMIFLFSFFFLQICQAEEGITSEKYRIIKLEEITVTATRTERPIMDAPVSVTVINKDEIKAAPFERVEDIIRTEVGIQNFRHYGMQTNGIVSPIIMRGVGKNRVLFLVDGVPQNDNFNNAIAWTAWGHIPKESIERIEIVRGPASALYGSEGLGGVINIITKKPKEKAETAVTAKYGTSETYSGSMFHANKIEKFSYMISGGYEESDGFWRCDPREYFPADIREKNYREAGKVFGKIGYDLDERSDINLAFLYYDHDMGQGRENFHHDLTLDQYWAAYTRTGEAVDWKANVFLNNADKTAYQDTVKDQYATVDRKEKFDGAYNWGGDLQASINLWDSCALTLGVAYKDVIFKYDVDYLKAPDRRAGAEGEQQSVSPFLNMEARFFDAGLILNVGGRYDMIESVDGKNWDTKPDGGHAPYDNEYSDKKWENFSPKAGLAFHPDDKTALRASVGTGFRAPSLFEMYKVHIRSGGTYYRDANPDIDPEKIVSFDIGAERFFLDQLWSRIALYKSDATDYIGDKLINRYVKNGKTYSEYELDNISEVDIHGLEVELRWFTRSDLTLFANYTYNVSEIKDDDNVLLEGNYLAGDPKHKIRAGVVYKNPKYANISLFASYNRGLYSDNENDFEIDPYTTVDLSISRRLFDYLVLGLEIENVTDEKYDISRGTDYDIVAPGRIIMGSIRCEF
jgi:iron complex outermembrane receptor protein